MSCRPQRWLDFAGTFVPALGQTVTRSNSSLHKVILMQIPGCIFSWYTAFQNSCKALWLIKCHVPPLRLQYYPNQNGPERHSSELVLLCKWYGDTVVPLIWVSGCIPFVEVWKEHPQNSLHSSHRLFYTSTSTGTGKSTDRSCLC